MSGSRIRNQGSKNLPMYVYGRRERSGRPTRVSSAFRRQTNVVSPGDARKRLGFDAGYATRGCTDAAAAASGGAECGEAGGDPWSERCWTALISGCCCYGALRSPDSRLAVLWRGCAPACRRASASLVFASSAPQQHGCGVSADAEPWAGASAGVPWLPGH